MKSLRFKNPLDKEVLIYFAKTEDNFVKIGFTENKKQLKFRVSMIQSNNHKEIIIIRTILGTILTEQWLHNRYKIKHIRGEWFVFDEEMLIIIPPIIPIVIDILPKRLRNIPAKIFPKWGVSFENGSIKIGF
jgi:hypothetical protein